MRDYGGGNNVKEEMKERIKYYSDWQKVLWATMVLVIGGSVGLIFKSGYGEVRVTLGVLGFLSPRWFLEQLLCTCIDGFYIS